MSAKLRTHLSALWEVGRDLAQGGYPPFVTGGPLERGQVPVFVFHSLEPVSFEQRLRFLADNGYATLSADEHLAVLLGHRTPPDRAVVLTIDDGRASVWGVGYPLLRRYGMKAVVFLVPGRMRDRSGPRLPHWGDCLEGSAAPAEVLERDESAQGILTWQETEELAGSGCFDFQSHTLRHARIHVGPRLVDFVTPRSRQGYAAFDLPLIREREADIDPAEIPLGTPVLESSPRLAAEPRYYEDAAMRELCAEHVSAHGGERFFERSDWRAELRRVWQRAGRPPTGRLESPDERNDAQRLELAGARSAIEDRLGVPVHHLCYPWHASSPGAERLAVEAGYRTAYCGKVPSSGPITLRGGNPRAIARISEDYLHLLPGRGRRSLSAVLVAKVLRRLAPPRSTIAPDSRRPS